MQDALQRLSSAQALTVTAASTNTFDFSTAAQFGEGFHIGVMCQVGTTFTAAGAATLQVSAQGSLDNVTFFDLLMTAVIAVADLIAGRQILRIGLPLRQPNMAASVPYRYFRLYYTIATGPMTAGTVNAWLAAIEDRDQFRAAAKNFTS